MAEDKRKASLLTLRLKVKPESYAWLAQAARCV